MSDVTAINCCGATVVGMMRKLRIMAMIDKSP